jgi:hypothetical protein
VGVNGVNYNFGERLSAVPTGLVYSDSFSSTATFGPAPDLEILSKLQFLSTSTGTVDPVLKAQATFVDGVYRTLLGRAADGDGLVGWVVQLHNGASRADIVQGIWASAEHRGIEVDHFYSTFLHRSADTGGRAAWVNLLLAGANEADIARMFIASSEYQAAHSDNSSFVSGLYADVLGRVPTSGEVAGWVQTLQAGVSRDGLAVAFLTSAEAYGRMIDCDYRLFLNRSADAAGKQGWLALLTGGQLTPQMVSIAFLASDEYYAQAQAASMG